ncbi:hypothetical protein EN780_34925 [Mesorhizobium sp. M4B.F.Ca.ET.089.01.1.1]|uniref:hypothetical protein n=1 Tax=unclassified Mesorhizobium TaxID=325217 RepID=UPI000FE2A0B5|nr:MULTISPECIES: hypothetical protein [unclassified Mesorhizobium]RWX59241.1 hypothetical protein EN780_34925 [Mesorhizobium sp. M4B.F.Ca.ET.089.01.1.1]TIX20180.1 MAG: hypothetical protein E5V35_33235 [Mesorhizobium sp.]
MAEADQILSALAGFSHEARDWKYEAVGSGRNREIVCIHKLAHQAWAWPGATSLQALTILSARLRGLAATTITQPRRLDLGIS